MQRSESLLPKLRNGTDASAIRKGIGEILERNTATLVLAQRLFRVDRPNTEDDRMLVFDRLLGYQADDFVLAWARVCNERSPS